MEPDDQVALITGGTAGISPATARLFAREGARVFITGRDVERGKGVVDEIGGDVHFVQADLSDVDSVEASAGQTRPVDIAVNNAGSFPTGPTVDQDVAEFGPRARVDSVAPGPTRTDGVGVDARRQGARDRGGDPVPRVTGADYKVDAGGSIS